MKLITAIIPAYNPGNHLLESVESIFNQTYKNIEVILVNDCSGAEYTEIFNNILNKYPAIKFIENKQNKGVAASRNSGAENSSGEYLSFLDQDDIWKPEKLELQCRYLNESPETAYVTSRQRYFLSEGTIVPSWVKPEHMDISLPGFLPGTLMVRASVLKESGGFNESLKSGTDDVDWFFRAHNAGLKTYELPEILLLKRIHGENLSAKTISHNKELLSVVRMNLERRKNQSLTAS